MFIKLKRQGKMNVSCKYTYYSSESGTSVGISSKVKLLAPTCRKFM